MGIKEILKKNKKNSLGLLIILGINWNLIKKLQVNPKADSKKISDFANKKLVGKYIEQDKFMSTTCNYDFAENQARVDEGSKGIKGNENTPFYIVWEIMANKVHMLCLLRHFVKRRNLIVMNMNFYCKDLVFLMSWVLISKNMRNQKKVRDLLVACLKLGLDPELISPEKFPEEIEEEIKEIKEKH